MSKYAYLSFMLRAILDNDDAAREQAEEVSYDYGEEEMEALHKILHTLLCHARRERGESIV